MAVSVTTEPSFSAGSPARLFANRALRHATTRIQYDVTADGKRFAVGENLADERPASIRVVQNWYEEFRDRKQD